jgi:hypothetical protein
VVALGNTLACEACASSSRFGTHARSAGRPAKTAVTTVNRTGIFRETDFLKNLRVRLRANVITSSVPCPAPIMEHVEILLWHHEIQWQMSAVAASVAAGSPTGLWRMSGHPAVQHALRNHFFDALGLPRMLVLGPA